MRADLHRFKAYIMMKRSRVGAWRGTIEDGELVEAHDESYDAEREYSDIEDIYEDDSAGEDHDEDDEDRPAPRERERSMSRS